MTWADGIELIRQVSQTLVVSAFDIPHDAEAGIWVLVSRTKEWTSQTHKHSL